MAQWINVLRNNSFINPTQLPLLCRNSRAVALVQPGLTAGWQSGRRNATTFRDFKIIILDEILEIYGRSKKYIVIIVVPIHFRYCFHVICILTRVLEVRKLWVPLFFGSIPTIKYYRT